MSPFDLYELCVQSPRSIVAFLLSVHGQRPTVLREDFCGTAAVSRRWVHEGLKRGELWRAEAVDLDGAVLEYARASARAESVAEGIQFLLTDAIHAGVDVFDEADVVYVGNFSIGEIHDRADLAAYFTRCRERLARGNRGFGGGVLVADLSAGPGCFAPLEIRRRHRSRDHADVEYVWRHEQGDPVTRLVVNSISFSVRGASGPPLELPRAFVYRWRVWSPEELAHAAGEAGFGEPEFYRHEALAPGESPRRFDPANDPGDWVAYWVARA